MNRRIVIGSNKLQLPAGVDSRLARLGWTVITATGVDAARVVARETRPAKIVLPYTRDQENAILVCAKLVQELPRTRIIVVGPNDAECERFARFAGAAGYVTNDMDSDEFVAILTNGSMTAAC